MSMTGSTYQEHDKRGIRELGGEEKVGWDAVTTGCYVLNSFEGTD